MNEKSFTSSLFACSRVLTLPVSVGGLSIGADAPIRVQSMTTTDTNDVQASILQSLRIVQAGGEIVRLTTQGVREAQSIGLVRDGLRQRGCSVPLVADIHFNPNAAEVAAARVEAVRINPGNYTGEAKRFRSDVDSISDDEWHRMIVDKISPLVGICKANNTAIRIGVNHGSLSDRIMAKYGDTPQGMVASCVEYLDAFEELGFRQIVISIKSSNTRVMVQTVRLLSATMRQRGVSYPLHLGVTEAGSDAEGRIKSAAGIGALLADGLGDTIRVSLTEAPEAEIPVAQALVDHFNRLRSVPPIPEVDTSSYSPYAYSRRNSLPVCGIGGLADPVVLSSSSDDSDADFFVSGSHMFPMGSDSSIPVFDALDSLPSDDATAAVRIALDDLSDGALASCRNRCNLILLAQPRSLNVLAELRAISLRLSAAGVSAPLVACLSSSQSDPVRFQIEAAATLGLIFIDGLADGIFLRNDSLDSRFLSQTAFLLLQATRARFTRTEFISCPGCGRTLYDIQSTVAAIKSRMGRLRGLKIGVMGCIVNGIGEMADADYGYVGAGRGNISLYRGREVVRRAIPQEQALDALAEIIKSDGKWIED